MRLLARNKQTLWFANPSQSDWVIDDNGLKTGEKTITYGTPQSAKMSIAISSGANNLGSQGMAELERYGIATGYTHRATTEDLNCAMGEESIIWFGVPHEQVNQTQQMVDGEMQTIEETVLLPHNFQVVRKAKSLNHLIYYLKEVDVS